MLGVPDVPSLGVALHGRRLALWWDPRRGGHHWRVAKAVQDEATLSTVTPLDTPDRVDEIARMLAGDTITDEARAAARALLQP